MPCPGKKILVNYRLNTRPSGRVTREYAVLRAWKSLDSLLRATVDEPREDTTIEAFADTLLLRQSHWFYISSGVNSRNDQSSENATNCRSHSVDDPKDFPQIPPPRATQLFDDEQGSYDTHGYNLQIAAPAASQRMTWQKTISQMTAIIR
ncbi:hypothetical protein V8E54_008788 [Elaphomyces granulatus]